MVPPEARTQVRHSRLREKVSAGRRPAPAEAPPQTPPGRAPDPGVNGNDTTRFHYPQNKRQRRLFHFLRKRHNRHKASTSRVSITEGFWRESFPPSRVKGRPPLAAGGTTHSRKKDMLQCPYRNISATSASSPISTTASRRSPTASLRSRGWCRNAKNATSTLTAWTSNASAASPSRRRASASPTSRKTASSTC